MPPMRTLLLSALSLLAASQPEALLSAHSVRLHAPLPSNPGSVPEKDGLVYIRCYSTSSASSLSSAREAAVRTHGLHATLPVEAVSASAGSLDSVAGAPVFELGDWSQLQFEPLFCELYDIDAANDPNATTGHIIGGVLVQRGNFANSSELRCDQRSDMRPEARLMRHIAALHSQRRQRTCTPPQPPLRAPTASSRS